MINETFRLLCPMLEPQAPVCLRTSHLGHGTGQVPRTTCGQWLPNWTEQV